MIRLMKSEIGVNDYPEVSRGALGHNLCNCNGPKCEVEKFLGILRIHHTIKIMWDHLVC